MIGAARRVGSRLRRRLRPPRRPRGPAALVLCYHRVAGLDRDPQRLAVEPERFSRQLAALTARYRVVPLSRLTEDVRSGAIADGVVALTFDDGYADNLREAAPRLERAGAHATVFVTTHPVDRGVEFWWDRVERALLASPGLPAEFELAELGLRFDGLEPEPSDPAWDVSRPPRTSRERAYLRCCGALRALEPARRDGVIDRLEGLAGIGAGCRGSHAPLTPEGVRALADSPAVEIGAHTLDHPVLSAMGESGQRDQILGSRDRLAELVGREPRLFSYPFGTADDFDSCSARAVESSGFAGACANIPGLVTASSDPMSLPRVLARNWEPETLLRAVERSFAGEALYF